ncbi:MAG: glycosyltransferase family 4 protein, partial [Myxococcales bacterium]|nr:glycosyltransferase family 4 protein [Myxococcales bacterium]
MAEKITFVVDRLDRVATGLERYANELIQHVRSAPECEWETEILELRPILEAQGRVGRVLSRITGLDIDRMGVGGDLIHCLVPLPVKTARPLVATVHDVIPLIFPGTYSLTAVVMMNAYMQVLLAQRAHLVANSQCTASDAVRLLGAHWDRITITPLGISAHIKPKSRDQIAQAKKKYGLVAPYFLFLGAMNRRKNLARALEAFARLVRTHSKHRFALAGRTDWGGEEVLAHIERLGISDSIDWLEYVDDDDLPALLGGSVALVYPSLYEGFGFPILEAMAAGTLVV